MIKVQIINKGHQPLPAFATPQSAGMDLRANIDEAIVLHPMERRLVPTGLYMALPAGYEAQIRPRSGLALKHGITVLNTPGTIDADYRGEIMVLLINFSTEDFVINDGERIAQRCWLSTNNAISSRLMSSMRPNVEPVDMVIRV